MPSHFSTIGLSITSESEYLTLMEKIFPLAKVIEVEEGFYHHWQDESGAALWIQVSQDNELIGINPHFVGQARINVGLTHSVTHPQSSPLDGALHGWANPHPNHPDSGLYPFVFDLPDFKRHKTRTYPSIAAVQVAAFAHEVDVYESVDAYYDAPAESMKFASQSFIPSGLFSFSEEGMGPPEAEGLFTGHIVQSAERINTATGRKFIWCLIDSLGGSFDVVIDPELVTSTPQVGGVLSGSFWLSGMLLS